MKIYNPATNQLIKEIPEDTAVSLEGKYKNLSLGQKDFARKPLKDRLIMMSKFAESLRQQKDSLAKILTNETGKPLSEAAGEINAAAEKIQFFLQESESILEKKMVHADDSTEEFISYDPLGVITNISAWNYPYLVGVNIFVPALICGNAVLYKPSEFASLTGLEIQRLIIEAGFPKNVFEIAIGGPDVGEKILSMPLDGYFFTGSYNTGKHIAVTVAEKLVPVGLELGGKDPLYVTNEITSVADVAAAAASGAFYNNGQSCCSVERIYVHKEVYNEFMTNFLLAVDQLKVGNPLNEDTTNGAITRAQHLDFLLAQVSDAVKKGAKLERGGKIIEREGSFFSPTVLTNVNNQMDVMVEESFGPIIGIQAVANDNEALALMNASKFGLTASVYCNNLSRGEEIIAQLDSGTGYLNCCDRVSSYVPWSGRGNSGLGSSLSAHGLYAFCNPKAWQIRRG